MILDVDQKVIENLSAKKTCKLNDKKITLYYVNKINKIEIIRLDLDWLRFSLLT